MSARPTPALRRGGCDFGLDWAGRARAAHRSAITPRLAPRRLIGNPILGAAASAWRSSQRRRPLTPRRADARIADMAANSRSSRLLGRTLRMPAVLDRKGTRWMLQ